MSFLFGALTKELAGDKVSRMVRRKSMLEELGLFEKAFRLPIPKRKNFDLSFDSSSSFTASDFNEYKVALETIAESFQSLLYFTKLLRFKEES